MNHRPTRRPLRKPAHGPSRRPTPISPAQTEAAARGGRLQKLLAAAGVGSRREIERWIAAGRVAVAGRVAKLGERARPGDEIMLDGRPLTLGAARARPRVIAYHKPEGELVTRSDPEGRPTVFSRLPPLSRGRWIAVGRLDLNSSGLLLFTDSGELANRLMHPRHGVERVYLARVFGGLDSGAQRRLLAGVPLAEGLTGSFESIEPVGQPGGANRWYRVSLREGRNREVRRLFEAVGCKVSRLRRIRFGSVELPRQLPPGRWFELPPRQVLALLGSGVP